MGRWDTSWGEDARNGLIFSGSCMSDARFWFGPELERREGGLVPSGTLRVGDYGIKTYKAVGQPLIHHNWRCEYCGSLVPYEKYKCDNCGAPRLEGE